MPTSCQTKCLLLLWEQIKLRCAHGSDVDPNSFFLDSVSDSDPCTNSLTRNFFKWCPSLLSCVFWNLYDREKSFPTEKRRFFPFRVFDLRYFNKIFILQQCLDQNPSPNFFSDSDPAKIFGFRFEY
jgi:hypothetical protein